MCLLTALLSPLFATSQIRHHQSLYWLRYQNTLFFTPRTYWTTEIDNRRFFSHDIQNQLIIHSRGHRKVQKFDFGAGLTYSMNYAVVPESGPRRPTSEIRPVVEGSVELPVRRWYIHQRVRIDKRFLQADREESVFSDSDFYIRFRYRLQLQIPVKTDDEGSTIANLRIGDEIMLNHREASTIKTESMQI